MLERSDPTAPVTPAQVIKVQVDSGQIEASTRIKPSEDVKVDLLEEEEEEESPFEEAAVQRSFKRCQRLFLLFAPL